MDEMNEAQFSLSKYMFDKAESVFPGGPAMLHWKEVIDARADIFWHDFHALLTFREDIAISGAMRWAWSQECPLVYERRLRTV